MSFDPCGLDVPGDDIEAIQVLVRMLHKELGRPLTGLEVGTWTGRTALAMIEAGMDELHCVDTWRGTEDPNDLTHRLAQNREIYPIFKTNMGELLFKKVFPQIGVSRDIVQVWRKPIDFLFIDADHRYEEVLHDITEWSKFVVPGGIVSGHDYGAWAGVSKAVEETGAFMKVGSSIWWRRK